MKTPCPICGEGPRSHSVRVDVRLGSRASDYEGRSISCCGMCAQDVRDTLARVIDAAAKGPEVWAAFRNDLAEVPHGR